jgi:hypothetical protein
MNQHSQASGRQHLDDDSFGEKLAQEGLAGLVSSENILDNLLVEESSAQFESDKRHKQGKVNHYQTQGPKKSSQQAR